MKAKPYNNPKQRPGKESSRNVEICQKTRCISLFRYILYYLGRGVSVSLKCNKKYPLHFLSCVIGNTMSFVLNPLYYTYLLYSTCNNAVAIS